MYKKIYLEICIVCIVHCGVLFRTYPESLGFAAVAEGERVGIFFFIHICSFGLGSKRYAVEQKEG